MGTAAGLLHGAVLRVWGPLQVYTLRETKGKASVGTQNSTDFILTLRVPSH